MGKKILFLVNEDWGFYHFRLPLVMAMQDQDFEIVLVTQCHYYFKELQKMGIRIIPLSLVRGASNPFKDLVTLYHLILIYRREKPDIVHHVALKPIFLGSIATKFSHIKLVVNSITGLGYIFIRSGKRAKFARYFLRKILRYLLNLKNSLVIVQNADDYQELLSMNVKLEQLHVIQGSGVDLKRFVPQPDLMGIAPVVTMVSRMLRDKGVDEFVQAVNILKRKGLNFQAYLVGPLDSGNPTVISELQLHVWENQGLIKWLGYCPDLAPIWAQSHIGVLPSYREGLPKSLLEAAACARPIVTTNVPGCREVVINNENGFLVPARDSGALARAMAVLIENRALRIQMGKRGVNS